MHQSAFGRCIMAPARRNVLLASPENAQTQKNFFELFPFRLHSCDKRALGSLRGPNLKEGLRPLALRIFQADDEVQSPGEIAGHGCRVREGEVNAAAFGRIIGAVGLRGKVGK